MFLDFSQDNIDILTIRKHWNKLPEEYDPWDFFIQIPSSKILKYHNQFSWCSDIKTSKGIYLGSNEHINSLLTNLNSEKKDYTNIFVEPLANVPREDLKDNNVIRKRDLENSEVAIVPISNFSNFNEAGYENKTIILFNQETNKFLILTDFYYNWWNSDIPKEYKKYFTYNTLDDTFVTKLIDYGIIPSNYNIYFIGPVLNIRNDKEKSFITNLNKYKKIIFERDYNDYLNNKKEVLTLEMLNSIENVLKSDKTNQELALKMLYPFDPKPYAYTIAVMLNSKVSWHGIQYTSFWKITKFKKYLSLMGLDRSKFPYSYDRLQCLTFDICGPEDKEKIIKEIFNEASKSVEYCLNKIRNIKFLEDAKLEVPKFIYNEKDYYNPGK